MWKRQPRLNTFMLTSAVSAHPSMFFLCSSRQLHRLRAFSHFLLKHHFKPLTPLPCRNSAQWVQRAITSCLHYLVINSPVLVHLPPPTLAISAPTRQKRACQILFGACHLGSTTPGASHLLSDFRSSNRNSEVTKES